MIHSFKPASSLCGEAGMLSSHSDMVDCPSCKLIMSHDGHKSEGPIGDKLGTVVYRGVYVNCRYLAGASSNYQLFHVEEG